MGNVGRDNLKKEPERNARVKNTTSEMKTASDELISRLHKAEKRTHKSLRMNRNFKNRKVKHTNKTPNKQNRAKIKPGHPMIMKKL